MGGRPVTTATRTLADLLATGIAADLARELLKLPESQLPSLHSLASAAREPAIAALLSRLAL